MFFFNIVTCQHLAACLGKLAAKSVLLTYMMSRSHSGPLFLTLLGRCYLLHVSNDNYNDTLYKRYLQLIKMSYAYNLIFYLKYSQFCMSCLYFPKSIFCILIIYSNEIFLDLLLNYKPVTSSKPFFFMYLVISSYFIPVFFYRLPAYPFYGPLFFPKL